MQLDNSFIEGYEGVCRYDLYVPHYSCMQNFKLGYFGMILCLSCGCPSQNESGREGD